MGRSYLSIGILSELFSLHLRHGGFRWLFLCRTDLPPVRTSCSPSKQITISHLGAVRKSGLNGSEMCNFYFGSYSSMEPRACLCS